MIMHSNRTVIHPDYVGLGLGVKFINETSKLLLQKMNCRIMGKFSSVPVYKAFKKDTHWVLKEERIMCGNMHYGRNSNRKKGFRERGIKTWTFEYLP